MRNVLFSDTEKSQEKKPGRGLAVFRAFVGETTPHVSRCSLFVILLGMNMNI